MPCCAAPVRRRRRGGVAAGRALTGQAYGGVTPGASEASLQQDAYGVVLQTISDAAEEGGESGALSPVQLEVQRDLRRELQRPSTRLQPARRLELLGRSRSPPSLPHNRRGASPVHVRNSPADRWDHPSKDLSSSSAESSDTSGSDDEDGDAAAQFSRRLRAQHFDPSTIFTAFDPQRTGVITVEDFKDGLARLDASSALGRGGGRDGSTSVRSAEEFTAQCVHVGNIGGCTGFAADDERALVRRYEEHTGKPVLCAVIRYRAPTDEIPHNNWALLAFGNAASARELVGPDGARRVDPPAGLENISPTEHVVALINAKKALASDGAFGSIFRKLRERSMGLSGKRTASDVDDGGAANRGLLSMGDQLARLLSKDGKTITKQDFNEKVVGDQLARPGLMQRFRTVGKTVQTSSRLSGGSSARSSGISVDTGGEQRRSRSPDSRRGHEGDSKSKSRLRSTPRTQLGRELQAERRQRQREMLQNMKAKRQMREDAALEAQRAKEQRLAELAQDALAGGHAPRDLPPRDDSDDTATSEDDDAALAAKYLNPSGSHAPASPAKPQGKRSAGNGTKTVSNRQPTGAGTGAETRLSPTTSRLEAEIAASDAVKAAKESHEARRIINHEQGKRGHSEVVGRGHLLGASIDSVMAELQMADILASSIGEDDLMKLAGTCARIGVPRGEAVVAQGDICEDADASMFVVVEGLLTAWIETTSGGIETDVGTLRAGDIFGEQSLLLGKPRTATIVSGTECVLLQITKEEIAPLLRLTPALTVSLAQILVDRTAQNKQRARAAGGESADDRTSERADHIAAKRQQTGQMVADICKSYGIALARVRMEDSGYSDDEEDDSSALLTPTRRTGNTSHASAGRAARQAAQLDREIAQIREARDQYMAALAAADGKRMEKAYQSGKGESELAPAEQERRRQTVARYDSKLKAVDTAKRAVVYELHRQLSTAALTSTGTGSGAKWVEAQSQIDPRISTHSIDEVFDIVSRQKSSTALLRRGGGRLRSASAPRLRPPPVPSESAALESSRGAAGVFGRLSRSSFSERPGWAAAGSGASSPRMQRGRTRRASVSGVSTLLRSSLDGVRSGGLSGGVNAAAEAWEGME